MQVRYYYRVYTEMQGYTDPGWKGVRVRQGSHKHLYADEEVLQAKEDKQDDMITCNM